MRELASIKVDKDVVEQLTSLFDGTFQKFKTKPIKIKLVNELFFSYGATKRKMIQ